MAGVCDCSDLVSCALAVVAVSANTNAIDNLDITGSFPCAGDRCATYNSVSVNIGEKLGVRMAVIYSDSRLWNFSRTWRDI
jgi:hypothetical protein